MDTITIPSMTPFSVPEGATIEIFKEGLPMSEYCQKNLTTPNYGMPASPCRKMLGGFLPISGELSSKIAMVAVKELAGHTGRKFRLASPLEALVWKRFGISHPEEWAVPSKIFSGWFLCWIVRNSRAEFRLDACFSERNSKFEILIVEEVD